MLPRSRTATATATPSDGGAASLSSSSSTTRWRRTIIVLSIVAGCIVHQFYIIGSFLFYNAMQPDNVNAASPVPSHPVKFDCHPPRPLLRDDNQTKTTNSTSKQFCTWWQSSLPEPKSGNKMASNVTSSSCVSVSLILFGVPKEFDRIWKNYLKHVVHRNPNIQFEVHMHMYSDLAANFSNVKNNEINVTTQSPWDIQHVLESSIEGSALMEIGNTNAIPPIKLITSSQKEYDETRLLWVQERDIKPFSFMTTDILKNMFRQGNSIQQAYISASTKSLLGNNLAAETMAKKIYLFLRSDTLLISPIDITCTGLATNEIHVPSWQTKNFPELNDRTALAGSTAAYKYARAKSDVFREMILHERSAKVVRKLHNPEKMLKLYLKGEHFAGDGGDAKLLVKERELSWAKLIRVRSGGKLCDTWRFGVKATFLNETSL